MSRSIVWALGVVGLVLALVVRAVEPPRPATLFTQVIVLHDALIPTRIDVPPPGEPEQAPHLLTSVAGVVDDRQVHSWLYQSGRERVSLHRLSATPEPPRNASRIDLGDGASAHVFELADLSLLAWESAPGTTMVVVGMAPVHELREFARWARSLGPAAVDQS